MELMNLMAILMVGVFAETTYLTVRSFTPTKVAKDSILLDTSVLIDGRIVSIARSGLISATLVVPTSVVRELQFMADKADHDKRERARFGLDIIEQLQALEEVETQVVDDGITNQHGVDEQLIRLAKRWNAKLCTIDYNLNKSSRVQGVVVVNINELAHALRVAYLPGETFEVKLQQAGQETHQAVGYLDDGTMVVVDNAKKSIGSVVTVEATRMLQTAAGRMMFARYYSTEKHREQKTVLSSATKQQRREKPARKTAPQSQSSRRAKSEHANNAHRRRATRSAAGKQEESLVHLVND
ncbi:MAG: PIN/TRAM domain-containing protein [Acidobacteriota bacterium]